MGADPVPGAGPEQAQGGRPFLTEAIRSDPSLRVDLDTCLALGISPRRFTGWEPAEHTVHHYENDRLVSSTTTRDAEWDDIDQAIITCYVDYRNGLCPDCGRPLDETLRDLNRPEAEQPQYRGFYHWCLACYALERAQHKEDERDQDTIDHAPKGQRPFVPSRHRKWQIKRTA